MKLTTATIGCVAIAGVAFGAFAASGFGEGGTPEVSARTVSVQAHDSKAPPASARAASPRASLFKVIYKSTRAITLAPGHSAVTVRACPKGAAVLSGWFVRAGPERTGMVAAGSTPDGTRRWTLIVDNATGTPNKARFGIVCLNG